MSNSEKVLRLIKIITLIERRSGVTLNELISKCSVCERTIYRDLDALSQCGFSIYFDDAARCYRFMEKVFLRPLTFAVDEAAAMLACLDNFSTNDAPLGTSLRLAQDKILASLPLERQGLVEQARKNVDIQIQSKSSGISPQLVSRLEKSIEQKNSTLIRYYTKTRESETERLIDPYVITFRSAAWYLVGYCHLRQEIRMFRLDRIKEVSETKKSFKLPVDFSAQEYFSGSWLIERGDPVNVKLRFLPEAARWVKTELFHQSQQITECEDGTIIFEATVNGRREITRWILGYGSDVIVLEPLDLRSHLIEQANAMVRTYNPT